MKWIKWTILATCLSAGSCLNSPPEIVTVPAKGALFCDVEEMRRFTQAEIAWRVKHAPWNLRRDYKTNLTWERECEPNQGDK